MVVVGMAGLDSSSGVDGSALGETGSTRRSGEGRVERRGGNCGSGWAGGSRCRGCWKGAIMAFRSELKEGTGAGTLLVRRKEEEEGLERGEEEEEE